MLVAYVISTSFFEPKAYNFMVENFSAVSPGSSHIAIITIDDASLERIRWPWKREQYNKIFEYLDKYTMAKLIGFDAIIVTPDLENPDSDKKFFSEVKSINKLVTGFTALNAPYEAKVNGKYYDKIFKDKFQIKVRDERTNKPPSYYQSLSRFPKGYFNAVNKVGSVITTPDFDGYIRSIDQFTDYKGTLYPSLSLRMYAALHPEDTFIVKNNEIIASNSRLRIPSYSKNNGVFNNLHYYKQLELPNLEDTHKADSQDTPKTVSEDSHKTDSQNTHKTVSEYTHQTYSAIDIMDSLDMIKQGKEPKISPQEFENKIVFVGANAKAVAIGLADIKRTPISNSFPGVDIQATNLDNILHNEFLVQTNLFEDIVSILILLTATFLVIRYFSLFASLGIIALMMVSYISFCILCYRFNLVISVVTPITLQIITMTMAYSYRFILEGRNKEKIQNAMGKYISQDVMQNVVKNIDSLKLGGKRANVTVLFADIRGFTAMSEKMSAEEVSLILNEYFSQIEPIIAKHNGVINKFIGDAVMAIFGEPIQDKNHAVNAVRCADEMLKKVHELQIKWLKEGKPKIEIGIGINTDEAFVGNVGTETRLEYTVIGDMVNLASRIESYNKVYKTNFLISATTYEKIHNIADVIKISEVTIRGKAKKLDIYEVLRLVK